MDEQLALTDIEKAKIRAEETYRSEFRRQPKP